MMTSASIFLLLWLCFSQDTETHTDTQREGGLLTLALWAKGVRGTGLVSGGKGLSSY